MHESAKMIESVYKDRPGNPGASNTHQSSSSTHQSTNKNSTIKMKFFVAVMLLAFAAVALAETKPQEVESVEPSDTQARDKRGLVTIGAAAYTAPVAYSAYTAPVAPVAPVAYSAYNALPYAYSAYNAYPYYSSAYSAPYIVG